MSETKIKDLRINKGLTKQQLIDSTVITENELSFVTDDTVIDVPAPTESGKVLTSTEDGVEWAEGSSGLPDQTGHSGQFLTTDGTDASWSDKPLVNKAIESSSVVINPNPNSTTTQASGLYNTIIGYSARVNNIAAYYNTIIGHSANVYGIKNNNVVIGFGAESYAHSGTAIGANARISADYAIQIGTSGSVVARNNDANTVKIANVNGNFEIMSADGTIPEARLADTTNAAQGMVLTLDANLNAVWQAGGSGGGGVPTLTWYTVDTAGNTLTIADTSSAQLVKVYKNGLLLQPTEDYSISGTTLTTVTAMVVGDKITTEVFA